MTATRIAAAILLGFVAFAALVVAVDGWLGYRSRRGIAAAVAICLLALAGVVALLVQGCAP